jgi:sulfate transport system permease protein
MTGTTCGGRARTPRGSAGRSLLALAVVGVLIVVPVVHVFAQALADGVGPYWRALTASEDTRYAIALTLLVAPAAVLLNTVFGVAAAWAIARFRFPGRALLLSLIDLPFSVSPVVAGLAFVLLFGLQGALGVWLREHGIAVIFATPGLILATAFVTFPFVARELIPLLEIQGPDEELAALSLGASGWQMFWRVTLSNIRWGLLYGVLQCNARAMPWENSGRFTSSPGASPARPTRCPCASRSCSRSTTCRGPSPWRRC